MATTRTDGTGVEGYARWGGVDWGAILAAVFSGLALTLLLSAIGAAIGITAADAANEELGTSVAIWGIIATAVGTFLGAYIGGAMMRWGARFSSLYHGVASWAFALIISIWLGVTAAAGLVGAVLQSAQTAAEAGADPGDVDVQVQGQFNLMQALEAGSWWLVVGLLVSLALSVAGWFLGARTNPIDEGPATTA